MKKIEEAVTFPSAINQKKIRRDLRCCITGNMLSVGRSLLSCSVYAVGRKWNFPRDASDSSCRIKKPFNFPSGRPGCCARLFLNNNPLPLHPPRRSSTHLRLANPVVPCNRWRSWSPEWSRYFFESQANAPELNRIPDEDGPRLSGGTGALWHANHRNAHGSLETSSFFFFSFSFPSPRPLWIMHTLRHCSFLRIDDVSYIHTCIFESSTRPTTRPSP